MEQPTRIIPLSGNRPGQQPSNIIRMEPDTGMIKLDISQGRDSVSGGTDSESAQRFGSEVKYITYFAQRLADILGMHELQLGVVEDREGQTAFSLAANGWHGAVSSNRKSLKQLRDSLVRK